MTEDEQDRIAATLGAHEKVLSFLLSTYLRRMSDEQKVAMLAAMAQSPGFAGSAGMAIDDIGMADDLAGLALHYRDAINRLFASALSGTNKEEGG